VSVRRPVIAVKWSLALTEQYGMHELCIRPGYFPSKFDMESIKIYQLQREMVRSFTKIFDITEASTRNDP
jgi:hypothetical protein